MDPVSLATAAIAALSPYLVKAGEGIAQEIGKQALAKAEAILKGLWSRWRDKPDAEKRLAAYVEDSSKGKEAMTAALAVEIAGDPEFARMLEALLAGSAQPEVFIKQVAEKDGTLIGVDVVGTDVRDLLHGKWIIDQTLNGSGTATGLKIDTLSRR